MPKNIKIKKSEPPESKEILAEAIVRIGDAMNKLTKDSGLNERAIIILIQAETKITRRDITTVLDSLKRLRGWYCK